MRKVFIFTFIFTGICSALYANNLTVASATLATPNAASHTVQVQFDISWDNSWRNNTNRDAAWVFVKYSTDSGVTWNHATLKTSGTNPSGFSAGSGTSVNLVVPTDKKGAFIERASSGSGTVSATSVQLVWDYNTDGLSDSATARVQVFGNEMVYVPSAGFYAGDNASSTASLKSGSADNTPWHVTSAGNISVTNAVSGGNYYVSGGNGGEGATGSSFTVSSNFPNGYGGFYLMKYELTQGQYVDFLNTLTRAQQQTRVATTLSDTVTNVYVLSNTASESNRNAIQCPATGNGVTDPVVFSATRPDRACNYISWMDGCAFADWQGLRPMTELEFEKVSRGPNGAVAGEMPWGNTTAVSAATVSGSEDGTETITDDGANACFGNVTFSGGDAGAGPLRAGIFATQTSTRQKAGAGYYGNMELGGNLWESVITVGNASGRAFTGTNGNGILTGTASYEGNATNTDWPGIDATTARGVTGAGGSGFKGGGFADASANLAISYRGVAANASTSRGSDRGFRAARTVA